MNPEDHTDITGLSQQVQIYILGGTLLFKLFGSFLGALTNGGGLKNILLNAWQGKNVPKQISDAVKNNPNSNPPVQ